jgi:glycosyltransferase involved in cell wall biosynthesis
MKMLFSHINRTESQPATHDFTYSSTRRFKVIKVVHLSFSGGGGAGNIARRLAEFSGSDDVFQELVVITEGDMRKIKWSHPKLFITAIYDFFIVRKFREIQLFTLFRRGGRGVFRMMRANPPDVLHIHWHPGVLSLEQIGELRRGHTRLVVTLHDMNPMTGGCHFAENCFGYKDQCESCPKVKSIFRRRVTAELNKKAEVFSAGDDLIVTSPASWLCVEASESTVFSKSEIVHIPNPLDLALFTPRPKEARQHTRESLNVPKDAFVLGFCAVNIADPRKNFEQLLQQFCLLRDELADKLELVLVVVGSGKSQVEDSLQGVRFLGEIKDVKDLISAYSTMDVFCSLSTDETFPNTIHECAALGIPSVVSDIPGHRHCKDVFGLVVNQENSFRDHILSVIYDAELRLGLSEGGLRYSRTLSGDAINKRYEELYRKLCDGSTV